MYSFKVQIPDIPVGPSQQTHAFTPVLTVTSKVVLDIKTKFLMVSILHGWNKLLSMLWISKLLETNMLNMLGTI